MTDTLPPPLLSQRNFMSSQSGNIQDLAAYSGTLPSFIVGGDAEPNSSPRHEFPHHSPIPPDMGLRFVNIPPQDARFSPESATSRSPLYTLDSNISNSSSSSFSGYSNVFPHGMSGSGAYLHNNTSYYTQNQSGYCESDTKPPLTSFVSPPIMAPPHRSPHLPQLTNSVSTRDLYTSATPQLRRTDLIPRSSGALSNIRALPLSPSSSSGFASPSNTMESQGGSSTPPLGATEILYQLQTSEGQQIRPDIHAKIDKGFFLEGEWTCYRRNYFSLTCSYSITPHLPTATLYLLQSGSSLQVYAFAMSIAAVVDGRDGKSIELVQHTPKRDRGPQSNPDRITLAPRGPVSGYGSTSESGTGSGNRPLFDGTYPPNPNPNQPQTEATFERIQFKQATANNGKRRAAQQYYHLLVELYADLGPQMGENRWIKIAQRVSCQMVVRGRSPGHYQAERRGSNASAGPSGSSGKGGGPSSYSTNGSYGRGGGDQSNMSGSMLSSTGYGGSYDTRSHHYLSTSLNHIENPLSPILSVEDIKEVEEPQVYTYNPFTMYENSNGQRLPTMMPNYRDEQRTQSYYQLPSLPMHMESPRIKQEGYSLPALPNGTPNCGRWEGVSVSRGYIPSTFSRNEVNTS